MVLFGDWFEIQVGFNLIFQSSCSLWTDDEQDSIINEVGLAAETVGLWSFVWFFGLNGESLVLMDEPRQNPPSKFSHKI